MTRPGFHAAGGRGHLRASDAEREQVIDAIKTAFAQGRLTKDELDSRAGQALQARTRGDLAAITASIPPDRNDMDVTAMPSGRHECDHHAVGREAVERGQTIGRGKKIAAIAGAVIAPPALWAIFLTYYGGFVIIFVVAFLGATLAAPQSPADRLRLPGGVRHAR